MTQNIEPERYWTLMSVLIEDKWGGGGSGFFIKRIFSDSMGKAVRFFLVTNKHVILRSANKPDKGDHLHITFNAWWPGLTTQRTTKVVPYYDQIGDNVWREHPDPEVDVAVLDITPIMVHYPDLGQIVLDTDALANQEVIKQWDIRVGDAVWMIGYPAFQNENYEILSREPLLESAKLASPLDQQYIEYSVGGRTERVVRGFVIDRAIVNGSSGSPVILTPTTNRSVHGKTFLGQSNPPFLLGIIAETRFASIESGRSIDLSFAGVGVAHNAVTIAETVAEFF